MPRIARIPITNVFVDGDYTGRILVGPDKQPMNVMLDTGSSAFAVDGHKYHPGSGDQTSNLAQSDGYEDGSSWTGAVIKTSVSVGTGTTEVTIADANVAVTYKQSADMFGKSDGILGLAYAPLDDAVKMPADTWMHRYTDAQLASGGTATLTPYLTQLAAANVVSDKVSFLTRRSFVHQGGGGAEDPLNQGWMIVGGGEESTDLYTGTFQVAKVLADEWYSTNLKAVIVGTSAIPVRRRGQKGSPSNSIVDSGTQTIDLDPHVLSAMLLKFSPAQQAQLTAAVLHDRSVPVANLDLASWPDVTFVLQGDGADVSLRVSPTDYWQVNAPKVGAATTAFSKGDVGQTILGLPLMNGYFTIFDGEADGGKGVIRFAARKR
jgi:hypothetical protein